MLLGLYARFKKFRILKFVMLETDRTNDIQPLSTWVATDTSLLTCYAKANRTTESWEAACTGVECAQNHVAVHGQWTAVSEVCTDAVVLRFLFIPFGQAP